MNTYLYIHIHRYTTLIFNNPSVRLLVHNFAALTLSEFYFIIILYLFWNETFWDILFSSAVVTKQSYQFFTVITNIVLVSWKTWGLEFLFKDTRSCNILPINVIGTAYVKRKFRREMEFTPPLHRFPSCLSKNQWYWNSDQNAPLRFENSD